MIVYDLHHFGLLFPRLYVRPDKESLRLTVDGDGNALAQDVAVSALESGDLAELVQLAVVVRDALGRLSVNLLKLEVVGLGDGIDGRGARVLL